MFQNFKIRSKANILLRLGGFFLSSFSAFYGMKRRIDKIFFKNILFLS